MSDYTHNLLLFLDNYGNFSVESNILIERNYSVDAWIFYANYELTDVYDLRIASELNIFVGAISHADISEQQCGNKNAYYHSRHRTLKQWIEEVISKINKEFLHDEESPQKWRVAVRLHKRSVRKSGWGYFKYCFDPVDSTRDDAFTKTNNFEFSENGMPITVCYRCFDNHRGESLRTPLVTLRTNATRDDKFFRLLARSFDPQLTEANKVQATKGDFLSSK